MNLKNGIIIFAVLAMLVGCSKADQKKAGLKTAKKPAKSGKVNKMVGKKKELPRVFQTARYTDNVKWNNGVNRNEKNQFFITIGKNDPTPIGVEYTLQFARAGEAQVKKVYRFETKDGSSIFIKVDKELDPVGDGCPNRISVKRFQIRPGTYSKENEWKNGISLKTSGGFFFVLKKGEAIPVTTGDRLRFAAAGEAKVEKISQSKEQGPYMNIYVKVDRPLDPVKDGAPKAIDVLIAQ